MRSLLSNRSLLSGVLALFAAAAALFGGATLLQPLRFFQPADFRSARLFRLIMSAYTHNSSHFHSMLLSTSCCQCCRSTAGPLGASLMRSYGANLLLVAPVMVTLKVRLGSRGTAYFCCRRHA